MQRRKYIFLVLALVVVAASLVGILAGRGLFSAKPLASQSVSGSIINMGFTYLPVKDKSACCYGLKPVNGALVTGVDKGGLADRAGLKPRDLIVAFNGIDLDINIPLLGLIRGCSSDSNVTVKIQDPGANRIITVSNLR